MSVIANGEITQLSVSQCERFDHTQKGGCNLAWWLERKHHQRPDSTAAKDAGDAGHELFATYFRGGELPTRAKMLKHVSFAVLKGDLPEPGPDMLVEWRGDGQEKFSKFTCSCDHPNSAHEDSVGKCSAPGCECEIQKPKWIPLLKAKTLHLGGIPFELFGDLAFNRDGIPTVVDHKFSSDPVAYAKTDEEIVKTIQMPVYPLALMNLGHWRDAKEWRLLHNYNGRTAGTQFFRGGVFSLDEILERKADIEERVIPAMKAVAKAEKQEDVPFNRRACEMWHGCEHQSICHAYRGNKMSLKPEEAALFADLEAPAVVEEPKKRKLPPIVDVEDDDVAKLEAELAAKKAAKAKAAADAEAAAKAKADAEAKRQYEAKIAAVQIPDSAPAESLVPDPKSDGGQPAPATAKGRGTKAPAVGPATVTVTVSLDVFDKIRAFLK